MNSGNTSGKGHMKLSFQAAAGISAPGLLLAVCMTMWPPAAFAQLSVGTVSTTGTMQYVHPGQISPEYAQIFRVLGTRLQTPGKERLVVTGALTQPAKVASATNVQVVSDISGQLHVAWNTGGSVSSVAFNGQSLSDSGGSANQADQALADTLAGDTVEHFLLGQKSGYATRVLAWHARVASSPVSSPAYCDVYQVVDLGTATAQSAGQVKTYCFDSTTHLLSSVAYQTTTATGATTQVQTRFSNWQTIDSPPQSVPWKIERYENGSLVLSLTVQGASLAATANDGLFAIKN